MPIDRIVVGTMREEASRQDTIAQNLANVSTAGYRRQLPFNDGSGFRTVLDRSQGLLTETASPLDLSIRGNGGWFVVSNNGQAQLTRDGSFQVGADGVLATRDGRPVRGRGGDTIKLDPTAAYEVGQDGTIRQRGQAVDQVLVVDPGADTPLRSVGRASYEVPADAQLTPMNAVLEQGRVEAANVNPLTEMTEFMMSARSFEFGQKALSIDSEIQRMLIRDVGRTR